MTQFKQSIFTAAFALAILFTISCSSGDGGNDPASSNSGPIKKARITGVSQKGPFVEGSTATLYELNDSFEQTGRNFRDIIADNKGTFEIKNIELISPYAMLEASGYYRNENTGEISAAPITLFAIADIREKDQVNVNILTHLEYYRVLNLVEGGKSVKDAKRQAQKEIFAVFGIDSDSFKDSEDMSIFGASESDAALLAISVLLQGDLSEGEFSQRLTNFSQAIKTGGTWDNEEAKTAIERWASKVYGGIVYCQYGSDRNSCWDMPTDDMCVSGRLTHSCLNSSIALPDLAEIRSNILSWELSADVPDFKKYVYAYLVAAHELGVCDSETQDNIKTYSVCKDGVCAAGSDYICKAGIWQGASDIEVYCFENSCETFIDLRNNEKYKTINVAGLTIMVDPLRYRGENNELGVLKESWDDYGIVSVPLQNVVIYTENEKEMDGLCPSDWRIPLRSETQETFLRGSYWTSEKSDPGARNSPKLVYCVKD